MQFKTVSYRANDHEWVYYLFITLKQYKWVNHTVCPSIHSDWLQKLFSSLKWTDAQTNKQAAQSSSFLNKSPLWLCCRFSEIIDDLAHLVDKTDSRIRNETRRVKLVETKSASCGESFSIFQKKSRLPVSRTNQLVFFRCCIIATTWRLFCQVLLLLFQALHVSFCFWDTSSCCVTSWLWTFLSCWKDWRVKVMTTGRTFKVFATC